MLTREELAALKAALPIDPARAALLETLRARAAPLLERLPVIPECKALLARNAGVCPEDRSTLVFDPWSPDRHRCPRCGRTLSGPRHTESWARAQHLWLAERSVDLALCGALTDERGALTRSTELLSRYAELYFRLPNRDNVLGPSHLFFSTYLESLWITSYLAAAVLLRNAELLPSEAASGIDRVADEAAALIGEFTEGYSNRQTWHAAALAAIAAWFDDVELCRTAVESRTGLLGHLTDGFGSDGMWWEGENYHLFALRGLMLGIQWARLLGFDLLDDAELKRHFRAALLAPALSALPDFTYPARGDSRYGVSLAQPASRELWEIGRVWLGGDEQLEGWLAALDRVPRPLPAAEHYDAWLHDAGRNPPGDPSPQSGLSWWALTALHPIQVSTTTWQPGTVLLADQGLVVLRRADRYASLECGPVIGGHRHPDRLQLSFHADAVHWLPDPGTGSYVQDSLAWYRSPLAHNAPLLDGENAGGADAWCEACAAAPSLAWCRGRAGRVCRTLILAADHLVDVLELDPAPGDPINELLLPWHFQGDVSFESAGEWVPAELEYPGASQLERFAPATSSPLRLLARDPESGSALSITLLAPGAQLLRARALGLPTSSASRQFFLLRACNPDRVRWVGVLDLAPAQSAAAVKSLAANDGLVELGTADGPVRYRVTATGLELEQAGKLERLAGLRRPPPPARRSGFWEARSRSEAGALAPRIAEPPPLDGGLDGFELSAPLELDSELQYRRSEEPYDPERFSARGWLNWDGDALYLAVAVTKPEVLFRPADAPPLELDNEADDLNSDGLQVYLGDEDLFWGMLLSPAEQGALHARAIGPAVEGVTAAGSWKPTADGYNVTARLTDPRLALLGPGARLRFDLLVNEMRPGRIRRAGQLVWGGAGGWIYLRGDRHALADAGILELA